MAQALAWSGLSEEAWKAIARQLGDPDLEDLLVVASIDAAAVHGGLSSAAPGGQPITPVIRAKAILTVNAVRAKFGAGPLGPSMPSPSAGGGISSTDIEHLVKAAAASALPGMQQKAHTKIKAAAIIDQGLDVEVAMLAPEELAAARRRFQTVEGDDPLEVEEVTDAQLSALHGKISLLGMAPFVDMGVGGPYGDRIARTMKFTSRHLDPHTGTWTSTEIPGARTLEDWNAAWRVFRTAMIMLGGAPAAVLDRYAAEFNRRALEYPDCWGLAAQADMRMRAEWWTAEHRRHQAFHVAQPSMSAYITTQPWCSVIKSSATAVEFWSREFDKPALRHACTSGARSAVHSSLSRDIAPPPGVWHQGNQNQQQGKRQPAKRASDEQRKDGRYLKSYEGVEICYTWTRNQDGCSKETCPHGRSHVCEWCRQPHRSIRCPQHPDWKPDSGKGKGKSGDGGGKHQKKKRRHN